MAAILLIKARVTAYDHWRNAYDANSAFRRERGVMGDEVYCSPEDMTSVLVLHSFDTVDAAQHFTTDPAFAETLHSSGVIGNPILTITEVV
ncbi:MAG: antibiotic biosynthesis monooxygenase [Acidimicrobiales bacterium]